MKFLTSRASEFQALQIPVFLNSGDLVFLSTVVTWVLDSVMLHLHNHDLHYCISFPEHLHLFPVLVFFLIRPVLQPYWDICPLTFANMLSFPSSLSSPCRLEYITCHLNESFTILSSCFSPCPSTPDNPNLKIDVQSWIIIAVFLGVALSYLYHWVSWEEIQASQYHVYCCIPWDSTNVLQSFHKFLPGFFLLPMQAVACCTSS
jgi:hypothetical protein